MAKTKKCILSLLSLFMLIFKELLIKAHKQRGKQSKLRIKAQDGPILEVIIRLFSSYFAQRAQKS